MTSCPDPDCNQVLPAKENEIMWDVRCAKTGRLYHLTGMKRYLGIDKIQDIPIYEGCGRNE